MRIATPCQAVLLTLLVASLCSGLALPAQTTQERTYKVGPSETLHARVPQSWQETVDLPGDDREGSITFEVGTERETVRLLLIPMWTLRHGGRRMSGDEYGDWLYVHYRKILPSEGYQEDIDRSVEAAAWNFTIATVYRRHDGIADGATYKLFLSTEAGRSNRQVMVECLLDTEEPEGDTVSAAVGVLKSLTLASTSSEGYLADPPPELTKKIALLADRVDGYYSVLKQGKYKKLRNYRLGNAELYPRSAEAWRQTRILMDNTRIQSWTILEIALLGDRALVEIEFEGRARPSSSYPWDPFSSSEALFWVFDDGTWYEVDRQQAMETWDSDEAVIVPVPAGHGED